MLSLNKKKKHIFISVFEFVFDIHIGMNKYVCKVRK